MSSPQQLNASGQLPFQLELLKNAENYQRWVLDCVKPFLVESMP